MNVQELYDRLTKAYSYENLNLITGKLILLYKNRNFGKIREIANKISKYELIEEENDSKCFSKLIMLYHPDKGEQHRKAIEQLYAQKDLENLTRYSHILLIPDLDHVPSMTTADDIDYQPEYEWDAKGNDAFGYRDADRDSDSDDSYEAGFETGDYERSFYNMIKIREYGTVDMEFPSYYLEDFEEFEMAYRGLESLDGVEYCTHVKILDVSNNALSDISNLWGLKNLEELYLSNNQIGYIDALSNLINLKILDLADNRIDDISPILDLENLEFVNLIGNPVPVDQIAMLEDKGVITVANKVRTRGQINPLIQSKK
jgi:Leucine-rich repeat (LRR) protein